MSDPYDNRAVEDFLNELTVLCLKHGLFISTIFAEDRYDLPEIQSVSGNNFEGYSSHGSSGLVFFMSNPSQVPKQDFMAHGVDLSKMSAHELMALKRAAREQGR